MNDTLSLLNSISMLGPIQRWGLNPASGLKDETGSYEFNLHSRLAFVAGGNYFTWILKWVFLREQES